jgi:hypothetical protein
LREARRIVISLRMGHGHDNDGVTLEELEDALKVVAYAVMRFGNVYAPIMERLEREVEAARRDDPRLRARRILEDYTLVGARNAMRLSHSSFTASGKPNP